MEPEQFVIVSSRNLSRSDLTYGILEDHCSPPRLNWGCIGRATVFDSPPFDILVQYGASDGAATIFRVDTHTFAKWKAYGEPVTRLPNDDVDRIVTIKDLIDQLQRAVDKGVPVGTNVTFEFDGGAHEAVVKNKNIRFSYDLFTRSRGLVIKL